MGFVLRAMELIVVMQVVIILTLIVQNTVIEMNISQALSYGLMMIHLIEHVVVLVEIVFLTATALVMVCMT